MDLVTKKRRLTKKENREKRHGFSDQEKEKGDVAQW